jgi:hypothetical protein
LIHINLVARHSITAKGSQHPWSTNRGFKANLGGHPGELDRLKLERPATGVTPMFPLRIPAEMLGEVDAWIRSQGLDISRSEAIRRLLAIGLGKDRRKG